MGAGMCPGMMAWCVVHCHASHCCLRACRLLQMTMDGGWLTLERPVTVLCQDALNFFEVLDEEEVPQRPPFLCSKWISGDNEQEGHCASFH